MSIEQREPQEIEDVSGYFVVDVREFHELASGTIEGALHLPVGEILRGNFDQIPQDQAVLLVCAVGGRSQRAAEFLLAQGYEKLVNLSGGMRAWLGSGKPVR